MFTAWFVSARNTPLVRCLQKDNTLTVIVFWRESEITRIIAAQTSVEQKPKQTLSNVTHSSALWIHTRTLTLVDISLWPTDPYCCKMTLFHRNHKITEGEKRERTS